MTFNLVQAKIHLDKGHDMVHRLCRSEKKWEMHIPADVNNDPDLVIGQALSDADKLITVLEEFRSHLWAIKAYATDRESPISALSEEERLSAIAAQAEAAFSLVP